MTRSLGESLDRERSWREKLVMKLHLFTCEACTRYLEQIEFLKVAAHIHSTGPADDARESRVALSVDAKERLRSRLRASIGLAF